MSDKGDEKKAEGQARAETAEELLARAVELLERRGGAREKSYRSAAAKVRGVLAWLEGRK